MSDSDETTKHIRDTARIQHGNAAVLPLPEYSETDYVLGNAVSQYIRAGNERDEQLQRSYAAVIAAILG